MDLSSLGLSWHYRMPVLTAWSTPGASTCRGGACGRGMPCPLCWQQESGLTLRGVGAAFWGVVTGALALAVQRWRQKPPVSAPVS